MPTTTHEERVSQQPRAHENRDRARPTVRQTPDIAFKRPQPFYGSATPRVWSSEEEELARSIAQELNYAAAVVAREPDGCYPEKSAAGAMKSLLDGLSDERLARARERAEQLLEQPAAERYRQFGRFANAGAKSRISKPVIDEYRRGLLREAARKRVAAQQGELQAAYDYAVAGGMTAFDVCPSSLEGVRSTELNAYYTQLGISSPQLLKFRWNTQCEDGEIGRWEVRRLPSRTVVASGTVALNSTFDIDFSSFLAPQPSSSPQTYDVRIRPHLAPRFDKVPGATPGSSKVVKIPAQPIGSFSNPVLISYHKDTFVTEFDSTMEHPGAELHVDQIKLIQQQSGLGADEYRVYATLVEENGDQKPVQSFLFDRQFVLNGEGDVDPIQYSRWFRLEPSTASAWPKTFTLHLTVMEKDLGEEIAEMFNKIWELIESLIGNDLYEEVRDALGNFGTGTFVAAGAAGGVAALIAAISGSVLGAVGGAILSALAGVFALVVQAAEDDFLGSKIVVFSLPTNDHDFVKQAFDGTARADGKYVIKPELVQFKEWVMGPFYDAHVEIKVHWELDKPELLMP